MLNVRLFFFLYSASFMLVVLLSPTTSLGQSTLEERISKIEELLSNFSRTGNEIYISGANLNIRDGSGTSYDSTNGLGNLIIGYNEEGFIGNDRSGSHNVVIGKGHTYSSYGGFVSGRSNSITGPSATVSGGMHNEASGKGATVVGGSGNKALKGNASIAGGLGNKAIGIDSFVAGGFMNQASGVGASITGGFNNRASENGSTVSGGSNNEAAGVVSHVSGGSNNEASGTASTVSGGDYNIASDLGSTIGGGKGKKDTGKWTFIEEKVGFQNVGDYELQENVTLGNDNVPGEFSVRLKDGNNILRVLPGPYPFPPPRFDYPNYTNPPRATVIVGNSRYLKPDYLENFTGHTYTDVDFEVRAPGESADHAHYQGGSALYLDSSLGKLTVKGDLGIGGDALQKDSSDGFVKGWAVVNGDGSLVKCFRCSGSYRDSTGFYVVDFSPISDVRNRPRFANLVAGGGEAGNADKLLLANSLSEGKLHVITLNSNNNAEDCIQFVIVVI